MMNKSIAFIDFEFDPESYRILDIGAVKTNNAVFHSSSVRDFITFISDADYLCGHNPRRCLP